MGFHQKMMLKIHQETLKYTIFKTIPEEFANWMIQKNRRKYFIIEIPKLMISVIMGIWGNEYLSRQSPQITNYKL